MMGWRRRDFVLTGERKREEKVKERNKERVRKGEREEAFTPLFLSSVFWPCAMERSLLSL